MNAASSAQAASAGAIASAGPYDALSVREARARYFADNGFPADGGYSAKWVHLKLGPIPFAFPNTQARVAAVKLHDLHHVATGYATSATGEAEIGAWEIASGCGPFVAAWILNLFAMCYGTWIAPRALLRAFVRGRRSANLYHGAVISEAFLDTPVTDLREQLHVPTGPVRAGAADVVSFAIWSLAAAALGLVTLAIPVALVWGLVGLVV